jgi:hypothetical protein
MKGESLVVLVVAYSLKRVGTVQRSAREIAFVSIAICRDISMGYCRQLSAFKAKRAQIEVV